MRFRFAMRGGFVAGLLLSLLVCGSCGVYAQQKAATAAKPGELTVERIFSQPSLGGRMTRGVAWAPDNKRISYFETKGSGKDAKPELWTMDATTGARAVLVSAEKLEGALPAAPSKNTQATGAGRRAPAQYQWAPGGDALLLEGPHALAWFDLKSQTVRVLVSGKEDLSDVKISPDGKYVSFVREHNVWLVSTADGKEKAMDLGTETDMYIPRVNWLPDSKRLAIQRLNRRQTILDVLLADTATGKTSTLLSEKDDYWINVSDDLHFLKDGKRFLWSSER